MEIGSELVRACHSLSHSLMETTNDIYNKNVICFEYSPRISPVCQFSTSSMAALSVACAASVLITFSGPFLYRTWSRRVERNGVCGR